MNLRSFFVRSIGIVAVVSLALAGCGGSGGGTGVTSQGRLLSVAITPNPGIVKAGNKNKFFAIGNYSDGKQLELNLLSGVEWESANTNIGTIARDGAESGAFTGNNVGRTVITFRITGFSDSTAEVQVI